MDTDELSREAYEGIIIEAEKLSHDLTLHSGLLSYDCKDETEYIEKAEKHTRKLLQVFLGSAAKDSSVTFKGSVEAVRNFIEAGSSAELSRTGSQSLSIEVTDKEGGAVVLRLFRIKRNGEIY